MNIIRTLRMRYASFIEMQRRALGKRILRDLGQPVFIPIEELQRYSSLDDYPALRLAIDVVLYTGVSIAFICMLTPVMMVFAVAYLAICLGTAVYFGRSLKLVTVRADSERG